MVIRWIFLSCVVLTVESKVDFTELNDEEKLESEAYSAQPLATYSVIFDGSIRAIAGDSVDFVPYHRCGSVSIYRFGKVLEAFILGNFYLFSEFYVMSFVN